MSRKPKARRRPVRRPSKRRLTIPELVFVVLVVFALVLQAVAALYRWLAQHWYVDVVLGVVLVLGVWGWAAERAQQERDRTERLRRLRYGMDEILAMTPHQFELACQELLRRDGIDARHVGRSNDQAADVIGRDRAGRTIVVQCKHTTTGRNVAVGVLYQVNGTARQVHGGDIVIVVTNGGFTEAAWAWGARHGIHLLDQRKLTQWAGHGRDLYTVLQISRPVSGSGASSPPIA